MALAIWAVAYQQNMMGFNSTTKETCSYLLSSLQSFMGQWVISIDKSSIGPTAQYYGKASYRTWVYQFSIRIV